jgi:Mg2+ and Co2+ transporter CorA
VDSHFPVVELTLSQVDHLEAKVHSSERVQGGLLQQLGNIRKRLAHLRQRLWFDSLGAISQTFCFFV